MHCVNVRDDSTHHRYILRLVSQSLGVFCEFEVRGVQICFAKAHEVFHKIVIYKARVNFIKTEGVFCKIDIHKVCSLQNVIHGLRVDFTKV